MKPLEEIYRARNQSCRLVIEATQGALTPELVKKTLGVRTAQIKRFVVKTREAGTIDDVTLVLARVSPQETQAIVDKLGSVAGVSQVSVVTRADDRAVLDT